MQQDDLKPLALNRHKNQDRIPAKQTRKQPSREEQHLAALERLHREAMFHEPERWDGMS